MFHSVRAGLTYGVTTPDAFAIAILHDQRHDILRVWARGDDETHTPPVAIAEDVAPL